MSKSCKKILITALTVLVAIISLILIYRYDQKQRYDAMKPNMCLTPEEVTTYYGYFDLWMPKDENPNISCDITSYCFGDANIWFFMPTDNTLNNSVIYARDEFGNLLGRYVIDRDDDFPFSIYSVKKQESVLPIMYINLDNPAEYDRMLETLDKSIICYGDMEIYVDKKTARENGWFTEYLSREGASNRTRTMSIRGRGNQSWSDGDKKSFVLELEKKENILGMGSRNEWNLVGNAFDYTLVKNQVFGDMATDIGIAYQPAMQPINLVIDGEYRGVYHITGRIKPDKQGVPMTKGDFFYCFDSPEPKVSFGYDSIYWFDDGNGSATAELLYPKKPDNAQYAKAKENFQHMIDAIEGDDYDELARWVDIDSAVRYYWLQELAMNFDGWGRSLYCYYRHTDGKFYFGPVWDMDSALGMPYDKAGMMFDTPEGWYMKNAGIYEALFSHEEFKKACYEAYFDGGIRNVFMSGPDRFHKAMDELGYDAILNYAFFGSKSKGSSFEYGGESYEEFSENMIDFYKRRMEFIDEKMQEP